MLFEKKLIKLRDIMSNEIRETQRNKDYLFLYAEAKKN
jgi:hypothetical protein